MSTSTTELILHEAQKSENERRLRMEKTKGFIMRVVNNAPFILALGIIKMMQYDRHPLFTLFNFVIILFVAFYLETKIEVYRQKQNVLFPVLLDYIYKLIVIAEQLFILLSLNIITTLLTSIVQERIWELTSVIRPFIAILVIIGILDMLTKFFYYNQ